MVSVNGIEFELAGRPFKCAVLLRGGLVAVAPTSDGDCCQHVVRLTAPGALVERTVPIPAWEHVAALAADLCVTEGGLDHTIQPAPWVYKALVVPALSPPIIPGTDTPYMAVAKTAHGVIGRRTPDLHKPLARIRVASLKGPQTPDPLLPFHKADKYINSDHTAAWSTVVPTHLSAVAHGGINLRAVIARGLLVLLKFENGV